MREIYSIIEKIAPTATTVVIDGRDRHRQGSRRAGDPLAVAASRNELVVFDCGAVPPNLIESELFGHEKGSFTGAVMTREGLFETADGGTLFLDELGELPLDLQPKLLRALEQREVRRVGANKAQKVDVRIIAATNRNLEDEVRAGRFRQDLFYRLSVVRLHLPRCAIAPTTFRCSSSTSSITATITALAGGASKIRSVSRDAMSALQRYPWPGNVRELVNVVERAVSFCDHATIERRTCPITSARRRHRRPSTTPRRSARRASRRVRASPHAAADARGAARRGRHVQGREGTLGRDVRARLHRADAPPQQRQHLARRAASRHRSQVLPQADEEVRHRCGRR